jgi:dCTP deaminase
MSVISEEMSFISKDEIIKRFEDQFRKGTMREECFSKSGASYDLRLGQEALVTPDKTPRSLQNGEILNIEPGQFAVLTTKEELTVPKDLLGFITVRFKYKSKGLVNISGFHVDPGFDGLLVFSVFNAGPATVSLREGDKVFSIFFTKISPPCNYGNSDSPQKRIPLEIIETFAGANIPSLQKLEKKVERNSLLIAVYGTILTGLAVGLIGTIIQMLLQ